MSNTSILIVENEAIIAADIANKLRKLDYDVVSSTDTGEDAIEFARQLRPSLVLMDIRLAGEMDGITAADIIRRECQVPVVFLSAHSDKTTVQRARHAEAFGFIMKPFDNRELHTQIEMALYKHAVERRLRESQARLATFSAATFEGIIEIKEGRIVDCNDQFAQILGYPVAELKGMEIADLIVSEDRDRVTANIQQEREAITEHDMLRKDGTRVVVEAHGRPLSPGRRITVIRDITEQKNRELRLQKLNRTLKAITHSSEAMMHATEEAAYLNEICKNIVEDCGHAMAWIGYAENDASQSVRSVASAGLGIDYLESLNITYADTERGCGPTGTTIRTGRISICRNIMTDPKFAPWRKEALKRGYASSIVLPLMAEGRCFGAINIYSSQPDPFSEGEVILLAELADNLAYGITSLRLRAERDRAVEALQKAHDRLEQQVSERTAELVVAMEAAETRKKIAETALAEINDLKNQLEAERAYLQEEIQLENNHANIIGQSGALKYVLYKVDQIASIDTTVLILGETGTGKELVARAIHGLSSRKTRALVKVNCATLPSNLIESELFGHEKGAFTDSHSRHLGRFEVANGGTLFLDEIGELPLALQSKLLRVLQDKEFERLGSSSTIKVDVRIIAATNRNLEEEVRKGNFREDLWFRLNVFPITTPPLRERLEDIPLLVDFYAKKISKRMGKAIEIIPSNVIDTLQDYQWPGNIRELENVLERAVINSSGPKLRLADELRNPLKGSSTSQKTLETVERDYIVQTLEKTHWKVSGKNGAAEILGLDRSTLRTRMLKLNIQKA
ncbi:MAG: sigma 54-interacting transcriptional regulator [Desulfobacteraceae bacterium]|jgi:chemotaxis protein methyltransferase CheR